MDLSLVRDVDVLAAGWNHMPDEIIEDMKTLGFTYCGSAPAEMNKYHDQWFIQLTP